MKKELPSAYHLPPAYHHCIDQSVSHDDDSGTNTTTFTNKEHVCCKCVRLERALSRMIKELSENIAARMSCLSNDETILASLLKEYETLKHETKILPNSPAATKATAISAISATRKLTDKLVEAVSMFYDAHGRYPKRYEVDMSDSQVRSAGGFRQLVNLAKCKQQIIMDVSK